MGDEPSSLKDDKNIIIQKDPKVIIVVLSVIILLWVAFQYRSNSFFTHEGISLGMSPMEVLEVLPDAGEFRKVRFIDQRSGNIVNFEMLEAKVKPVPWERLFIVSMEGEVVGISAYASDITKEQIDELRANVASLYGLPDDIFKSEYGSETLVWGDVDFDMKDVMQGITKIDGRVIIYRSRKSGTVNIYVTRDGKGPRIFF
ncbi:hypothetical protein MNBD_ALPHA01-175 [hydrothermal vent metagenome]|uniref:Uncharacterized protein n=1 Tax=hydrothermal vent metagenome TaxID=652676 RepID=A0A3B0S3T5_9ZZZZ